jgi:site-specific DNA recombinase
MALENFKQFAKGPDKKINYNKEVWLYTRVSSKDQEVNKSLENQKDAGYLFAASNKYIITETFGGTFESASGDFTRKEFSKLVEAIRRAKKKPFALLIYTMSRFSRTGGNGISLAHDLVEVMGVNLIEVSTGKNTITPEGRLEIYNGLLKASQENIDRLKVTLPGMKKGLESGMWFGHAPLGYVHYGPRVKNKKFFAEFQRIEKSTDAPLVKLAWEMKLRGEQDFVIIKHLEKLGLKINKQRISKMWRNPFYVGIGVNKLLDGKVVYGNWDKYVSESEFLIVQEILKGNKFGYKTEKSNPNRPLAGFICCIKCGGKMTGYEVKERGLHYYKCQKCLSMSINAMDSVGGKKAGAHELFVKLLKNYELTPELIEPFKAQLKLTYGTLNEEKSMGQDGLTSELEKLNSGLKSLKRKYALEGLEKDLYEEFKEELEGKIHLINQKLEREACGVSNISKYINVSTQVLENLTSYWIQGDLDTKRKIQELVFPEGIFIETKKRQYLTKKINSVFNVMSVLSRVATDGNKNSPDDLSEESLLVAGG